MPFKPLNAIQMNLKWDFVFHLKKFMHEMASFGTPRALFRNALKFLNEFRPNSTLNYLKPSEITIYGEPAINIYSQT